MGDTYVTTKMGRQRQGAAHSRNLFLGSAGGDSAAGAEFQRNGSIVALVNVADPSAFAAYNPQRLGDDPAPDEETEITVKKGKRERVIKLEQRAPMLLQFNEDLSEIAKVIQFPLRTGTGMALETGVDGSVSATLRLRPGDGRANLLSTLQSSEIPREDGKEEMFGTMVVHFDQELNFKWSHFFAGRRNIAVHHLQDGRLRITSGLTTLVDGFVRKTHRWSGNAAWPRRKYGRFAGRWQHCINRLF